MALPWLLSGRVFLPDTLSLSLTALRPTREKGGFLHFGEDSTGTCLDEEWWSSDGSPGREGWPLPLQHLRALQLRGLRAAEVSVQVSLSPGVWDKLESISTQMGHSPHL